MWEDCAGLLAAWRKKSWGGDGEGRKGGWGSMFRSVAQVSCCAVLFAVLQLCRSQIAVEEDDEDDQF